ncbi:MAG: hypothetical protein HYX27_15405 [Acidobacteria bacterium]|nr:hypothetical protein [Acidobacteriota bacterium]
MWLNVLISVFLAAVGAMIFAGSRWNAKTGKLRDKLLAARAPLPPETPQNPEWASLPAPVARYLREALPPHQPRIAIARFTHTGTFNTGQTIPNWRPFTSDQLVIAHRPGFDWDARISMVPGITSFVHDAYVNGQGILHGKALAMVPVVDVRGTPEIAQDELERYLGEAPWYPTRLLPGNGVTWEPAGDNAAVATLRDGPTAATLTFHFSANGLVNQVSAAARNRLVKGVNVPTPWQGRFWSYESRGGYLIPTEAEVAWLLPGGPWPYWRGRLTRLNFEFERFAS